MTGWVNLPGEAAPTATTSDVAERFISRSSQLKIVEQNDGYSARLSISEYTSTLGENP
jgi:hypothetical protein